MLKTTRGIDYQEGNWTPTDASGAGLSFTILNAKFTKNGRQVTYFAWITFPSTVSTATLRIGGLPFSAGTAQDGLGVTAFNDKGFQMFARASTPSTIMFVNSINTEMTNANLSGGLFGFQYTIFT